MADEAKSKLVRASGMARLAINNHIANTGADEESALVDLLADLMHWAHETDGQDFDEALRYAKAHFSDEQAQASGLLHVHAKNMSREAQAREFTVWVRQANREGTTYATCVKARSQIAAEAKAKRECSANWGDNYPPDSLEIVGVAEGNVKILDWND